MNDNWRQRLPRAADRRIARARHARRAPARSDPASPWVFDGSVTSVSDTAAPGDLAVIFDDQRRFRGDRVLGSGFAGAGQGAPRRCADHDRRACGGAPRLAPRSTAARRSPPTTRRPPIGACTARTTGYRRWSSTATTRRSSSSCTARPGSPTSRRSSTRWSTCSHPSGSCCGFARRLRRATRSVSPTATRSSAQPPERPVLFRERGLTMEADVVHGQKTGHYLDQRDNRMLVRGIAAGRDVLDVFASTGGFALAAAAGGARSVHLVDQSAPALAAAERNLAHNLRLREVRECAIHTTVGDAFDVLASSFGGPARRRALRPRRARPAVVRVAGNPRSTGRCAPTPRSPGSAWRCCGRAACSCRRRARAA